MQLNFSVSSSLFLFYVWDQFPFPHQWFQVLCMFVLQMSLSVRSQGTSGKLEHSPKFMFMVSQRQLIQNWIIQRSVHPCAHWWGFGPSGRNLYCGSTYQKILHVQNCSSIVLLLDDKFWGMGWSENWRYSWWNASSVVHSSSSPCGTWEMDVMCLFSTSCADSFEQNFWNSGFSLKVRVLNVRKLQWTDLCILYNTNL